MAVWAILAIVGAVGVPFYLRFLIAMRGEWKRVQVFYLARIRPAVQEITVIEPKRKKSMASRAA
jgi:hypothetical protein